MEHKQLIDYTDALGLIGQRKYKDGKLYIEGGDSLQRTGMIAIGSYFEFGPQLARQLFLGRIKHHEISRGKLVRHPDPKEWYSKESSTSRDQLTPVIIACGLLGCSDLLRRIFIQHLKRFGFYPNWRESDGSFKIADFASPEHCGFYIRAFNAVSLRYLLYFCDIFSLIGSCYKTYIYGRTPKNVDDLNRMVSLIQSNTVMPTPISRLSLWVYKRRPSTVVGKSGPRYALERYFSGTEDPPIPNFWQKALRDFFD